MENNTRKQVFFDESQSVYRFNCPHCEGNVEVLQDQINCQIFRHGVMRSDGNPINPHSPKDHCDRLVQKELVWGCCKPLKFIHSNPPYVEICDYI